jgi:hypothetical protein
VFGEEMNKSKTQNQKQPIKNTKKKQKTHTKIQTLSFFLSSINIIIIITYRLLLDRRRARHTIVVTRIAWMLGPQVQIGGGSCPGDRRTGRVSTTATTTTTAATGNTTIGAGATATAGTTATATDNPSTALLDHARHFVHVSRITCAAGPPSGTAVSGAPTTVAPAGPRGAAAAAAAATAAPRAVPGLTRPVAAPAPVRIAPPSPPLPQTLLAAASCVR